jgi:hypothetical protein
LGPSPFAHHKAWWRSAGADPDRESDSTEGTRHHTKIQETGEIFPIGIAEFALMSPLSDDLPLEQRLDKILDARLIDGNDEFAKMYKRGHIKELINVPLGRLLPAHSRMRELYEKWIQGGHAPFAFEAKETGLQSGTKRFEYTLIGTKDRELISLWWLKRDISEKENERF